MSIGSLLAVVIDHEERRLIAVARYGGEEVSGLAESHFRRKSRSLRDSGIEPRLGDRPSFVDEDLQIANGVSASHGEETLGLGGSTSQER